MKYLNEIENILNIIKFEENTIDVQEVELSKLVDKIINLDYYEQLEEIYLNLGVSYLGILNDQDPEYFAYQLGEYYQDNRHYVDGLSSQKQILKYELDCLYYAYKNGIEEAYDSLIICLLGYLNKYVVFYYFLSEEKEIFRIFEILEKIIDENNFKHQYLLNKRKAQYLKNKCDNKFEIIDKNNLLDIIRLYGDYLKVLKGHFFDSIEKMLEIMKWDRFKDTKINKELSYSLFEKYKIEYQFINKDHSCDEAISYFEKENFYECDNLFSDLLYLNNKYVYYNYGLFLKHGYYECDKEKALACFKKAYELGLIEASYHIADLVEDHELINTYANIAITNKINSGYVKLMGLNPENRLQIRKEMNQKNIEKYEHGE